MADMTQEEIEAYWAKGFDDNDEASGGHKEW